MEKSKNFEILKDLELVDVIESEDRYSLNFLEPTYQEIHEVIWNKKSYDRENQEWIDSPDQLVKIANYSKEYLGFDLSEIQKAVGQKHDIYSYETYESLWETDRRFYKEDVSDKLRTGIIKSIERTLDGITIRFSYDGGTYRSNMKFLKDGRRDAQKRKKQLRVFEDKFGVPIDKKDELIGSKVIFKVKDFRGNIFASVESKAE